MENIHNTTERTVTKIMGHKCKGYGLHEKRESIIEEKLEHATGKEKREHYR